MGWLEFKTDFYPMISVIIVTWNSAGSIRLCLDSIFEQLGDFEVETILVDNASSDQTLVYASQYAGINTIPNPENLGFCRGNNIGIAQAHGDYILLLNPDACLKSDYLQMIIPHIERDPNIALITGKVLLMSVDGLPLLRDGLPVIDTVGIRLKRNRQAEDIGKGEIDQGQYERPGEVFGVSGAVCLCRRQALEEAKVEGQVFDEAFFAYKEDVDLSWRLRLLGWKCYYTPNAIAYHARGWRPKTNRNDIPRMTRYYSFRNRRLVILKNDSLSRFLRDFFHIVTFELGSFSFALLREPFLLKTYGELLRNLPLIFRWRKAIHKHGSRIPQTSVYKVK
jgi:GT2 family glycosyltransferase